MATLIEPCPFCSSGHLHIRHQLLSHSVVCQTCKSTGPHRRQLEDAVLEWNHASKRLRHSAPPDTPQIYGRLTELEDAVRNLATTLRHGTESQVREEH
mgnify:CR=1 FL=1